MDQGNQAYHDSNLKIPKYPYLEDGGSISKNYSNFCPNQNKIEARTASYTLNNNYVNMQTKTPPWTYDYNSKEAEQGDLEDRYVISLSQGNGMSFMEMLLSVEAPSTSQSYLQSNFNGMEEGMGSETFMITGRYASSQSTLLDVQEEEAYEQPVFGDEYEELAEDETNIGNEDVPNYGSDSYYNWQFDDNENLNNDPVHNEQHIPKENNSFNNETHNNEDGEEAVMEMPEGVEQLTQEDICIFLENESVVAALQASQEVTGHHAPHLNMVFNTEEEAYKFYNEYASICVFSVKKAGNYKGKNIGNAIGTRRTYTSSKFGKVVAPELIEERKKKRQERNQQKVGNKVKCIFWSDGFSRHMHDLYGDCLSFDTTFKTNKYNPPFAPFVGVTGHGHNCLFTCAIVNNEQASTFEWLFEEFLICMGGKHPATIITDQDAAMAKAINEVFKQTCHRNCFFHIKRKSEEKCGGTFVARGENRKKFFPVYFKHDFLPFIHSTARSEGTNAIFKDNVGSTYSVISFLGEYQKISKNIEELEREQDSVTRITEPDYWVRSEIELQAGRMYEVYKTPMLQLQDFRSRKYLVSVNLQAEEFACICCKFEKDDIICAHILRVLIHLNLLELHEKYYINRWRPKDRKYIRDKHSIPIDLTTSNKHLRYCVLSRKFCNIASEGAVTERKYLFLLDEIKRIEDRLDEMTKEDETAEFQKREKVKQPCATSEQQKTSEQQHKDGFPDNIQDPDVVPSKGRPETSKRQRTFVEELMSKNQITCSHCGSHQHNIVHVQ
nr:protein FAR1-RELATED SEQUENCE 3-like [Lolium perenne]